MAINVANMRLAQRLKQTVKVVRKNPITEVSTDLAVNFDVVILPSVDAQQLLGVDITALEGDGWTGISLTPLGGLKKDDIIKDATEPQGDLFVGRVVNLAGIQWFEIRQ